MQQTKGALESFSQFIYQRSYCFLILVSATEEQSTTTTYLSVISSLTALRFAEEEGSFVQRIQTGLPLSTT